MRTEFKKLRSWGPAGIACQCCRPAHCTKQAARRIANRMARRHYTRMIRIELAEVNAA